ncbi:MAG: hypothetical protein ACRBBW_18985 [Cellvibrionaceae bacterium]
MEAVMENNDGESSEEASTYFSVSPLKLVIMSIGTFGIYDLYWFYKNFCHIKQKNNLDIMPFWRAFFAPLWSYSAFDHIQNEMNEQEIPLNIYAALFAVLYFLVQACWRLPDPYWLISIFSFLLIIPANNATTRINQKTKPEFVQNSKLKGWNWVAVLLGVPFMALAIIGTFLSAPA